jgi:hypothetical protein
MPRARLRAACFAAVFVLNASCGGAPPPPTNPSPTSQTDALLAIEAAVVDVLRFPATATFPASFGYEVRFLLRELGGRSGATIRTVSLPGEHRDLSCLKESLRVPPGATLDVFYSEEGLRRLGGCAPFAYGYTDPVTHLELVVTFLDDSGRGGITKVLLPVTYDTLVMAPK